MLCSSELSMPSLFVFTGSLHAPVCLSTGVCHSSWLFISVVMLAARAAVSRREAELDLVMTKTQSRGTVFGEFSASILRRKKSEEQTCLAGMKD